jgi:hypothetical protein
VPAIRGARPDRSNADEQTRIAAVNWPANEAMPRPIVTFAWSRT